MKTLILIAILFIADAHAGQMFQCNIEDYNSTDVLVVNLKDSNSGTLFLSSGMQMPEEERVLVNIKKDKEDAKNIIFVTENETDKAYISIPKDSIGVNSNLVQLILSFSTYSFNYFCFTRVY